MSTPQPETTTGRDDVRRILALDLGIGSYGIAFQKRTGEGKSAADYEFPLVRSCVLPGDWAELATERTRRRMWRTRTSHLEREKWLRRVFETSELEAGVLYGRRLKKIELPKVHPKQKRKHYRWELDEPGDFRLEREFPPSDGEETRDKASTLQARTVYAGAALRCLLLLGEKAQIVAQDRKLEPWQVFKALHSAIQKRGYDPDVPWKRARAVKSGDEEAEELTEVEKKEKDEEKATAARAQRMDEVLHDMVKDVPHGARYQHPCFWEAARMGLWSPERPEQIHLRTNYDAASCKWAEAPDPAEELKKKREDKPKPPPHAVLQKKLPAVFHRATVQKELLELCIAAGELLPSLRGKEMYIMYGPPEVAYPNVPRKSQPEEDKRREALQKLGIEQGKRYALGELRGNWVEYQGALAQKAPTFDNRGPGPCVLIPRYHAAKCDVQWDDEGKIVPNDRLLAAEVSFLLGAKNFRFTPEKPDQAIDKGYRDWLNAAELRRLYTEHFHSTVVERMSNVSAKDAITKTVLTKWLEQRVLEDARPKPGQEDANDGKLIDKPRVKGRSRFSRPALRLLRALLLSGYSPQNFQERLLDLTNAAEAICDIPSIGTWGQLRYDIRLVNKEGAFYVGENADKHGMQKSDLDFFKSIGASWEQISIRDGRLESFDADARKDDSELRNQAIGRMIQAEINPVIRHRLGLLSKLLDEVVAKCGEPDRVVLEFVRDEFMGKDSKRKQKLMKFQNERRDANSSARAELESLGIRDPHESMVMRWQLVRDQGGQCLLCGCGIGNPGSALAPEKGVGFDQTHLAHIVAKAAGGPRAYNNLTVACGDCNAAQSKEWHGVWIRRSNMDWNTFVRRVESSNIGGFKKKLLCTVDGDEALKMVQSRASLQQTAWIAKLAQVLVCLKFGWPLNFEGQQRNVVIVPGSATNSVAQKHKLYRILGEPGRIAELEQKIEDERGKLRQLFIDDAPPEKKKAQKKAVREAFKALDDKCRADKRHHALDAMVLSFLPHWVADTQKRELWFGLPDKKQNWQTWFKSILDQVVPEPLRLPRSKLGETTYGMRKDDQGQIRAVLRQEVVKMAYAKESPQGDPQEFGIKTLRAAIKTVLRRVVRNRLEQVADRVEKAAKPETAWLDEVKELRIKEGGPRIHKVLCWDQKVREVVHYQNMSKATHADKGQWKRTKKESRGQWVFWIKPARGKKLSLKVRSVKVFESPQSIREQIQAMPEVVSVLGFFQSGCLLDVYEKRTIGKKKSELPKGRYELCSIEADCRITLRATSGEIFDRVSISQITTPEVPNLQRVP